MGIPLITNDIGDCGRIIEDCNAGFVVNDFSSQSYDRIILQIDELIQKDKNAIRKNALRYYSLDNGVNKYAAVYHAVFTPSKETAAEKINLRLPNK